MYIPSVFDVLSSLKFNSSIHVFRETFFLVTVVIISLKNTCWIFVSNSRWAFRLYLSLAPFKPAESLRLVPLHFILLPLLHFKYKLNRWWRWWCVINIWRQKLLVSCFLQAVWYITVRIAALNLKLLYKVISKSIKGKYFGKSFHFQTFKINKL